MICIDAEHLQDGLYNIKDGKIYKYKAKGGTVRAYKLENRPQGAWIRYYPFMLSIEDQRFNGAKNPTEPIPDKRFGRSKCNICGNPKPSGESNYCPNCGADMRSKIVGKHADFMMIDEACAKGADDEAN